MNTELDPKTVDRAMDQVTVILDPITVDIESPSWDAAGAEDACDAFALIDRLDIHQQVTFLRHCAMRIRSSIIAREVEQEIAEERKALGDDFYRPRVTA
jgi:hypothetical protein